VRDKAYEVYVYKCEQLIVYKYQQFIFRFKSAIEYDNREKLHDLKQQFQLVSSLMSVITYKVINDDTLMSVITYKWWHL